MPHLEESGDAPSDKNHGYSGSQDDLAERRPLGKFNTFPRKDDEYADQWYVGVPVGVGVSLMP